MYLFSDSAKSIHSFSDSFSTFSHLSDVVIGVYRHIDFYCSDLELGLIDLGTECSDF
jgi:hypothetical protein